MKKWGGGGSTENTSSLQHITVPPLFPLERKKKMMYLNTVSIHPHVTQLLLNKQSKEASFVEVRRYPTSASHGINRLSGRHNVYLKVGNRSTECEIGYGSHC